MVTNADTIRVFDKRLADLAAQYEFLCAAPMPQPIVERASPFNSQESGTCWARWKTFSDGGRTRISLRCNLSYSLGPPWRLALDAHDASELQRQPTYSELSWPWRWLDLSERLEPEAADTHLDYLVLLLNWLDVGRLPTAAAWAAARRGKPLWVTPRVRRRRLNFS